MKKTFYKKIKNNKNFVFIQNSAYTITKTVDRCPRFRKTNETIFLPNKVSKEIVLDVENLPHPQFVHVGFLCIINIEGAKMMVPARVEKNRFVICDKTVVRI